MTGWKKASRTCGASKRPSSGKQFVRKKLHRQNRHKAKLAIKLAHEHTDKKLDEREIS